MLISIKDSLSLISNIKSIYGIRNKNDSQIDDKIENIFFGIYLKKTKGSISVGKTRNRQARPDCFILVTHTHSLPLPYGIADFSKKKIH
jgi:hypothetical protein